MMPNNTCSSNVNKEERIALIPPSIILKKTFESSHAQVYVKRLENHNAQTTDIVIQNIPTEKEEFKILNQAQNKKRLDPESAQSENKIEVKPAQIEGNPIDGTLKLKTKILGITERLRHQ